MPKDWFRNEKWSTEIESAFFLRLNKSKDKNQFLKVQAQHIRKNYPDKAFELLKMAIEIEPKNIFTSQIYHEMAMCCLLMDRSNEAVNYFRTSLLEEANRNGVNTDAYLDFSEHIVKNKLEELYDEAEIMLTSKEDMAVFPIQKFKLNKNLAYIYKHKGKNSEARFRAENALKQLNETKSGFRFHQNLGLVEEFDSKIIKELNEIKKTV